MTRRVHACVLFAGMLLWSPVETMPADVSSAIRVAVAGRQELESVYGPRGYEAIWIDAAGTLSPDGREAVQLLRGADRDGLNPGEYRTIAERWTAPAPERQEADPAAQLRARADVNLTGTVLRYLRDLHLGRVDPRAIGFMLNVPRDGHDFPGWLRAAIDAHDIGGLAARLRPVDSEYAALAAALARYREHARLQPGTLTLPAPVRPGQPLPLASALRDRLVLLGDASAAVADPGPVYDAALSAAVRRFQARHGLDADGVLGRRTAAALAVPLAWRVRQIELALERLRWLPHEPAGRLIVVNIPAFRLFAWDSSPPHGPPTFTSAVIVGRSVGTETPVFGARLSEISFRPYWNVPRSIVLKEVLPALARKPGYLHANDMELVEGPRDDSGVVSASRDTLDALRRGQVRLRQRPGPKNALGLIKFSFPNEHDVYMHATSAPALFARSRRDFSHGCIRVADPVGLAEWVLRDQPGWDRGTIDAAMHATQSSRVAVRAPVRVMLLYTTASVRLQTGEVVFAEDIYRHDQRLDAALNGAGPT